MRSLRLTASLFLTLTACSTSATPRPPTTSTGGAGGTSGGETGGSGGAPPTGSGGSGGGNVPVTPDGSASSPVDASATAPSDGSAPSDAPAAPAERGELGTTGFPGWKYTRTITIDTAATAVAGDVSDYALAVVLDGKAIDFSQARAGGEDLRFGTADGTPLPYALELWDPAGQSAAAWVKLDRVLGNNATQTITMYWGKADAGDASDSAAVFGTAAGFRGVWHLGEEGSTTADGYRDATATGAHGTGVNLGPGARVPGRIGRGTHVANAMEQWIKVEGDKAAMFNPLAQMTVSIWGKADGFPARSGPGGYDTIYSKGEAWTVQRFNNSKVFESCFDGGKAGCAVGKGTIDVGQWYHFVMVVTGGAQKFYVNGASYAADAAGTKTNDRPLGIGNQTQYLTNAGEKRSWDGTLDEARFYTTAKDPNWIKLDFESQREGSKLLTFGETKSR